MSSDEIALPCIQALHEFRGDINLKCIVSNEDKPKGRGKFLSPNEISAYAISNNIPLLRPAKPDISTIDALRKFEVNCIIVMAYGHILKEEFLNFPKLGCLNLHGSILPNLRGASPVETALALGFENTGVSLMRMERKMDSGDVCGIKTIKISSNDTGKSLRKKIGECARDLMIEKIFDVKNTSLVFHKQKNSDATYCRKLDRDDMKLNFFKTAKELNERIRAFNGGIFEYKNEIIKVGESSFWEEDFHNLKCGTVLESSIINGLRVACKDGIICFTKLQRPCGKMLSSKDFFNGYEIKSGDLLESFPNKDLLIVK